MSEWVIVVAGGSGTRMNTDVPKQFLPIAGMPILMHTLKAFYDYDQRIQILIVMARQDWPMWENLCRQFKFPILAPLVSGGEERFHSVRNGINTLPGNADFVAIHDAVRPFVSPYLIHRAFKKARETGAAVPGTLISDSVRQNVNGKWRAIDRNSLVAVQTPQVFEIGMLKTAYSQGYQERFTDDASVVEEAGYEITVIEGEQRNIKITTPEDLGLARAMTRDHRE
ncbi:MAG: 2-C-methyl-D-erythritol 4-phosphate cytidylyltransferase [Bacteroidia bacterium]